MSKSDTLQLLIAAFDVDDESAGVAGVDRLVAAFSANRIDHHRDGRHRRLASFA